MNNQQKTSVCRAFWAAAFALATGACGSDGSAEAYGVHGNGGASGSHAGRSGAGGTSSAAHSGGRGTVPRGGSVAAAGEAPEVAACAEPHNPPIWLSGAALSIDPKSGAVALSWPAAQGADHYSVFVDGARVASVGKPKFTVELAPGEEHVLRVDAVELCGSGAPGPSGTASSLPLPTPADVAPPLSPSGITPFSKAVSFLYEGTNPIQVEVEAGAIDPARVAVIRGKVTQCDGSPVVGAKVSVPNEPKLGVTFTRSDGGYDLVVNGCCELGVQVERAGYPTVQRKVRTTPHDYAQAPDVVLVPYDGAVTAITLPSDQAQSAQGSATKDSAGARRATVIVPPGVTASMVLDDGKETPLSELHVRATEYTNDGCGPSAMPAPLPAESAYTYAVELSVDEAIVARAKEVKFSKPVALYVENFLGFPVGSPVPTGYYNRETECWAPTPNGAIVKLLSIKDGIATLDLNGDGKSEDAAALAKAGITSEETRELASLYATGTTLWRSSLPHFSPWDLNWPFRPKGDGRLPYLAPVATNNLEPDFCESGSDLGCINQSMSETLPLASSGNALRYSSRLVPDAALRFEVTGKDVGSLSSASVEIEVAGVRTAREYPAKPSQTHRFNWDGRDAYGRAVVGAAPVTVRLTYRYPSVYEGPSDSFGSAGTTGPNWQYVSARQELELSTEWKGTLVARTPVTSPVAPGWSLADHSAFDPVNNAVYTSDGSIRTVAQRVAPSNQLVIDTVVGTGEEDFSGDGGPALGAALSSPRGITFAPDGTLYIADFGNHRIRRVKADGTIQTVAGTGKFDTTTAKQIWADGSDPLQADLGGPDSVSFDCEGNLFFFDASLAQYFRISKDNKLFTIPLRTNNETYVEGIPGPVESAVVDAWHIGAIAVGSDCRVYLAGDSNVFRIDADGQIRCVAGNLAHDPSGGVFTDGMPATAAPLANIGSIAYEPSGSLLIGAALPGGNGAPGSVFRVSADGTIRTVAGAHATATSVSGDNIPALEAGMQKMDGLQASRTKDGAFAFIDMAPGEDGEFGENWVRHVDRNGTIRTLAGAGALLGEHVSAHDARLTKAWALAFAPDNSLYVSLNGEHRVRRIASIRGLQTPLEPSAAPPPDGIAALVITAASTIASSETAIPDESGGVVDVFDKVTGVHQRTFDALTGALIRKYTHEGERLVAISDAYGNTTSYGYDDAGKLSTVTSPYGQVTQLTYDLDGNLSEVTNPAGEEFTMTYKSGTALLETLTNPRGKATTFAYDDIGRIVKDSDAAGASKTLEMTSSGTTPATKVTTALGRTNRYSAEMTPEGAVKRRSESRYYGASTTTVTAPDGGRTTTFQDGTTLETSEDADPRFGALSPFAATVTMSKGTQKSVIKTARSYSFGDPNDLLNISKFSETTNIDGDAYTRSYDRKTNTFTSTTPMVRVTTTKLNDAGQVIEIDAPGVAPVSIEYDERGRPTTFTQADRVSKLHYDEHGYVDYAVDPADRTQHFVHDAVGRVLSATLGDALDAPTLTSTFDKNGNLRTLKPPGSAEHALDYTPVDLLASYTPPPLTGVTSPGTEYTYNLDRQLTDIKRPDGAKVHMDYEPATARLASIVLPANDGTVSFTHDDDNTKELVGTVGPAGTGFTRTFANGVVTALSWNGTVNGVVRKRYDGKFRLDTESVDGIDGQDSFSYDRDGLLISAGGLTINREASTGRVSSTRLGVIEDARGCDPTFGEPTSYSAKTSSKTLFDVSYKRDKLGRITEKTEAVEGTSTRYAYHYDDQGRLDTITTDGAVTASYSYDANGNRTERQANGTTESASFDAQDRLTSFGNASYAYSDAGELVRKTEGPNTTTYRYDALGSLRSVTLPSSKVVSYEIDGLGRRVGKFVDGKLVNGYLYRSGTQLKAVTDGAGKVLASFGYGPAHTPTVMNTPSRVYRIIADHLGSVRLVVDANTGAIAQRIDYDEFGRVTQDTNPGFQPFGYAGGLYDPDTQLLHFGARDYDPEVGRWITKDPLLLGGGSNVYAYVGNDPINLTDISGLVAGVPDWLLWLADHGVLQGAGDFSAGVSSALTFGLSDKLIGLTGLGKYGSKCSGAYKIGRYSGMALGLAASVGGIARAATAASGDAAAMGGVLENGATVRHSATATAIGDDANTLQNFARSQGVGGHDVIVHGVMADGEAQFMVNGMATNPHQIANAVLENPAYTGGPINLVTCHGACGLAQELGSILGAPVRAFLGRVDLDPVTGALREIL